MRSTNGAVREAIKAGPCGFCALPMHLLQAFLARMTNPPPPLALQCTPLGTPPLASPQQCAEVWPLVEGHLAQLVEEGEGLGPFKGDSS